MMKKAKKKAKKSKMNFQNLKKEEKSTIRAIKQTFKIRRKLRDDGHPEHHGKKKKKHAKKKAHKKAPAKKTKKKGKKVENVTDMMGDIETKVLNTEAKKFDSGDITDAVTAPVPVSAGGDHDWSNMDDEHDDNDVTEPMPSAVAA